MKNTKYLMITLALATALPAFAYDGFGYRHHCLTDETIYLGADTDYTQPCTVAQALTLGKTTHTYPLLKDNPYTVEVWQASVDKTIITTTHSLRVVTNRCTGKVQYQKPVNQVDRAILRFDLQNPNLSDDIAATYNLVPMTDTEAQVAFQKLQQACENYKPGATN